MARYRDEAVNHPGVVHHGEQHTLWDDYDSKGGDYEETGAAPMNLTAEQRNSLSSICAQHGLDLVLRELACLIQDGLGQGISESLETFILTNANDVMKAADSITYRSYTGRDLYRHDYYREGPD